MFNADAIRKKLADISGKNSKKNLMWRPEEGKTYTVRFIPLSGSPDGSGLRDLWFYYGIGNNPGILAPYQFGKPDPVQDLIKKFRDDDTKDSYELAKKLYPKMRAFAAVIVRGEEDRGVRVWSFGKTVYQDILNIMLDADYGDIMDPKKGYDIKVSCEKVAGKQFADTSIRPRPNPSPLHEDVSKVKEWLNSIPNLDDLFYEKPHDELLKLLNDWIHPSGAPDSVGTSREGTHGDDDVPVQRAMVSNKKLDDAFADLDDL